MIGSSVLATALFAVSILGAPSKPAEQRSILGRWTLVDFDRDCDGFECHYSFGIDENNDGPVVPCTFNISGAEQGLPGNKTDFHDVECENQDGHFKVNGGWDRLGFTVVVVTDVAKSANAYFGFTDAEIDDTTVESKESNAYAVGTFGPDDVLLPEKQEGSKSLVARERKPISPGETWQIIDMTWWWNPNQIITVVDFTLVMHDGTREHCHLEETPTDLHGTWFGKQCSPNFTISWGYKKDTDGIVLTVCRPDWEQNAWFGWDGITRRHRLGNSTKNDVRWAKCE